MLTEITSQHNYDKITFTSWNPEDQSVRLFQNVKERDKGQNLVNKFYSSWFIILELREPMKCVKVLVKFGPL